MDMHMIVGVWQDRIAPNSNITEKDFHHPEMYELYKLVCSAYNTRREIECIEKERSEKVFSEKLNQIITYEKTILARLEVEVEKKLKKMRQIGLDK